MLKITNTAAVIFVLLIYSCSSSYNSFIGSHQEKPFEVQVNSSFDQVWATIEKVVADEEIPVYWKDKSGGILVSNPISFLDSYTFENAEGKLIDPSSSIVITGDESTEPSQVDGKWRIRVQSVDDNISIINVELDGSKATTISNGAKQNLGMLSTGAFEKKIYAMLVGKELDEVEDSMPKPVLSETKIETAPRPVEEKEIMQSEMDKPMAKESPIVGTPEVKKPESMPAAVDISNLVNKEHASKVSDTPTSEPNALSGSITLLKKQIENQERIIKEQREQLAALRSQQNTVATSINHNELINNNIQGTTERGDGLTIQFIALTESDRAFNEITDLGELLIEKVPNKNVYRYKIGHFANKLDAMRALTQIRSRGFGDAFIN